VLIDPVAAAGSTFRCIAVLVIYAGKLRAEARLPRVLGTASWSSEHPSTQEHGSNEQVAMPSYLMNVYPSDRWGNSWDSPCIHLLPI
jgi:hypothetical protein